MFIFCFTTSQKKEQIMDFLHTSRQAPYSYKFRENTGDEFREY